MNILKETNFKNLGEKKKGKVRDIYTQPDKIILVSTDRHSSFDRIKPLFEAISCPRLNIAIDFSATSSQISLETNPSETISAGVIGLSCSSDLVVGVRTGSSSF